MRQQLLGISLWQKENMIEIIDSKKLKVNKSC
jgi:hypothetical protein